MEERQTVPMAIEEAIAAGIPAAKAFRIYSDRTIPELAAATRLATGRICLIEAGSAPTEAEALVLGRALHIPVELLPVCR